MSAGHAASIGAGAAAETMVVNASPTATPTFVTGGATRAVTSATAAPTRGGTAPAASPAAVPPLPPIPVAQPRSGHPAVYVVLGGVLTIGALVAAGLYIRNAQADPRRSTETASAPAAPSGPAAPVAAAPAPPTASAVAPAPSEPISVAPAEPAAPAASATSPAPAASTSGSADAPGEVTSPRRPRPLPPAARAAALKEAARGPRPGPSGSVGAPKVAPPPPAIAEPPAQPAVDFDQLETEIDQLLVRAAVVNRSLETMQQQQARQGLSLRGDMAGRQTSMNLNLTRAEQAVQQQNAGRAMKFKAMAEADLEALERFLGR
jgi:hypothetical protein